MFSACIGLVQEMDWGLANTDGQKTLQVGSFRIDSDGKQALNKVAICITLSTLLNKC